MARATEAVVLGTRRPIQQGELEKAGGALERAGFRVLAIDFRGYGLSKGPGQSDPLSAPLHLDVLAAVRYLRKSGAKTVSVVGGSMGGGAPAMPRLRPSLARSIAWSFSAPEEATSPRK